MAGNSFGTIFRFTTWGESHGPAIGCVVDGTPPRLKLAAIGFELTSHFVESADQPGEFIERPHLHAIGEVALSHLVGAP